MGTIKAESNNPAGGIAISNATITNSNNTGNIISGGSEYVGEIIGRGNCDNTNSFLVKENNANANGATSKSKTEMDEIMSIQNFINLMNSYVTDNNTDSTKTKLKTWKLENGMPVFSE